MDIQDALGRVIAEGEKRLNSLKTSVEGHVESAVKEITQVRETVSGLVEMAKDLPSELLDNVFSLLVGDFEVSQDTQIVRAEATFNTAGGTYIRNELRGIGSDTQDLPKGKYRVMVLLKRVD